MASPDENPPASNIYLSEEWSKAAVSITFGSQNSPRPAVLVCGPKNSGKSTFSRHQLNVLLQKYKKVAFLDMDVGQTEFTPPGVLSLCIIENSSRDPGKYLQCVYALYDYYRDELCKSESSKSSMVELPLIVNTPGWIKGSGYEVLVKILNASIVGLGISSEESPDIHLCVGLGIVRGVDLSKGLLYVITPVPPTILEKVDVLLQGFIQIPQGFLQVQG
ncbi:hypothetical protein SAY86_026960 [Trapa natans]|uniref:Polynucleotide 5'-hydroxyl-kinase NOL9 n=1 Tax=Trapa natans TaxID=22666 RepID=A0AAN7KLJ2_TRANT|nr:hypothetical protein SAY86_026960 [Trapa natans]